MPMLNPSQPSPQPFSLATPRSVEASFFSTSTPIFQKGSGTLDHPSPYKGHPWVALWEKSLSTDVINPPNIRLWQNIPCQDGIVPHNHFTLIKFVEDPWLHKHLCQQCLKVPANTYAYNAQLYAILGLRIWVPHSTYCQRKNTHDGINSHRQQLPVSLP